MLTRKEKLFENGGQGNIKAACLIGGGCRRIQHFTAKESCLKI